MPTSKLPVHNVWVFFFILEIKDGLHSRTKFQDRAIWDNVKIIFNGKLFEILFKKSLNHMTANKNEMFLWWNFIRLVSCGYQKFKMVPTKGQSFSIEPYGKRNRLFFSEAMNSLHPNY